MMLIDSHTHIYDQAFDDDREQVIARAQAAGVDYLMCPAIDSQSHDRLLDTCTRYPGICLPMMGLHPTSVNDNPDWREELRIVEEYLANPPLGRFYAVGEVGLDLYWSKDSLEVQIEVLVAQAALALRYDLPLVVHTRDAWPQMLEVLQGFKGTGLRGVMHSFSGTIDDYRAVKDCGSFLFGIGGPVTYKNSSLPEIVAQLPMSDILLETDSPYLPPVPYRGKRNESGYLTYVCQKVAEIKGLEPEEVAAASSANAMRLFGL